MRIFCVMLRFTLKCSCAKITFDFFINFWPKNCCGGFLRQPGVKTPRSFKAAEVTTHFPARCLGWSQSLSGTIKNSQCKYCTGNKSSAEVRGYNKHLSKVVGFMSLRSTEQDWPIGKSIATGEDRKGRCKMSEG